MRRVLFLFNFYNLASALQLILSNVQSPRPTLTQVTFYWSILDNTKKPSHALIFPCILHVHTHNKHMYHMARAIKHNSNLTPATKKLSCTLRISPCASGAFLKMPGGLYPTFMTVRHTISTQHSLTRTTTAHVRFSPINGIGTIVLRGSVRVNSSIDISSQTTMFYNNIFIIK